jgi:hypothetical protein
MSSPDAEFAAETSQHSADADSADSSLAISAKKSSRRPAYKRDCAGQFQLQTPEAAPVNIFACKERPGMEALTQFLAPEFAV